jgi:hypothetical protein
MIAATGVRRQACSTGALEKSCVAPEFLHTACGCALLGSLSFADDFVK